MSDYHIGASFGARIGKDAENYAISDAPFFGSRCLNNSHGSIMHYLELTILVVFR